MPAGLMRSLRIAIRGEIACRIIAPREMGVPVVAVYSDADAKALHAGWPTKRYISTFRPRSSATGWLRKDRRVAGSRSSPTIILPAWIAMPRITRCAPSRWSKWFVMPVETVEVDC